MADFIVTSIQFDAVSGVIPQVDSGELWNDSSVQKMRFYSHAGKVRTVTTDEVTNYVVTKGPGLVFTNAGGIVLVGFGNN